MIYINIKKKYNIKNILFLFLSITNLLSKKANGLLDTEDLKGNAGYRRSRVHGGRILVGHSSSNKKGLKVINISNWSLKNRIRFVN